MGLLSLFFLIEVDGTNPVTFTAAVVMQLAKHGFRCGIYSQNLTLVVGHPIGFLS